MHAHLYTVLLAAQSTTDDGLTLRELAESLPSDPASIFALLLMTGSVVLVLWAGRGKKGGGGAAT